MLSFVSSRVGRRLVLLFGVCALLPLLGLAVLSYSAITDYLIESSQEQMRSGSKGYGMSLMDRLQVLEAALREVSLDDGEIQEPRTTLLSRQFAWLGVLSPANPPRTLIGEPALAPAAEQLDRLRAVREKTTLELAPSLLLAVGHRLDADRFRVVVGRPAPDFLWWGAVGGNTLPASTDMLVVADGSILLSTLPPDEGLAPELAARVSPPNLAHAPRWNPEGSSAVTALWTLPLSLPFDSADWVIAWTRPAGAVLQPVRQFAVPFILVLTATFLGVILLALSQIRRFLQPLERLRVGTQRVAQQDFSTPVHVSSDDEFADLAHSFNNMAQRLESVIDELHRHQLGTLRSLARTMDERSPWTQGHSGRVANLCRRIGEVMGLPEQDMIALHRAGLLHDIGKLHLPTELLEKAGDLTPDEFEQIQEHVAASVRILAPIPDFESVTPIVAQHHERLDGSGYPRGLVGDDIALGARILGVADSFDALSSDRPYRSRLTRGEVLAELHSAACRLYDPDVLAALDVVLDRESGGQGEPPTSSL